MLRAIFGALVKPRAHGIARKSKHRLLHVTSQREPASANKQKSRDVRAAGVLGKVYSRFLSKFNEPSCYISQRRGTCLAVSKGRISKGAWYVHCILRNT